MKYLIDTSAYSGFNRGDSQLKPIFQSANDLIVPLIVIGELRAGFRAGSKTVENEKLLRQLLDAPNVQTLSISHRTTELYAEVYLSLKQSGRPIGTNDMWIAALALEHNLMLATTDNDFMAIKGLKRAKI